MKQWIVLEDDSGDDHWLPFETESVNAGKGFKWICLARLIWIVAATAMGWFLLKVIWG